MTSLHFYMSVIMPSYMLISYNRDTVINWDKFSALYTAVCTTE